MAGNLRNRKSAICPGVKRSLKRTCRAPGNTRGRIMPVAPYFEIERKRGSLRVSAAGYPALGMALAFGAVAAAILCWIVARQLGVH